MRKVLRRSGPKEAWMEEGTAKERKPGKWDRAEKGEKEHGTGWREEGNDTKVCVEHGTAVDHHYGPAKHAPRPC